MNPQTGRCWSCGYLLHGAEQSRQCPECGRHFDPLDPHTMNPGPHLGSLAWWSLSRCSWAFVVLSAIAAGMVLWGTGRPVRFGEAFVDWPMWRSIRIILDHWIIATLRWRAFVAGVGLSLLLAALVLLRLAWRACTVWKYRPPREFRSRFAGRLTCMAIFWLLAAMVTCIGGTRRIGREWGSAQLAAPKTWGCVLAIDPPAKLTKEAELAAIHGLVINGDIVEQRMAGLKLLVERDPAAGIGVLTDAITRENDGDVLVWEIRLLSLYRNLSSADLIEKFLDDMRPEVRAAAIDALGVIHHPAYGLARVVCPSWQSELASTPPIDLIQLLRSSPVIAHQAAGEDFSSRMRLPTPIPMPAVRRAELLRRMTSAESISEREAAARAILAQPPQHYRLRVAEWGVWTGNSGNLKMARAELESVPSFVHRTGNPAKELANRVEKITIVFKPVIHLTVDQTMSVDMEVRIRHGRPWFVFPRPDDLEIRAEDVGYSEYRTPSPPRLLQILDPLELPMLSDLRSGYPWIRPSNERSGSCEGVWVRATTSLKSAFTGRA